MAKYMEELVAQQVRRYEMASQRRREPLTALVPPVLTLSRSLGSGARLVATQLAERLGFTVWEKRLLDDIARDAAVSSRVAESFDERTISELELLVRAALGEQELGSFRYEEHLARAVTHIARLGKAIILGRGANFLLPAALSVRLDASEEVRVRRLMTYEPLSEEQARQRIRESDRQRHDFLVKSYGRQMVEHCHFDISLWMDQLDTAGAVAILEAACRSYFRLPHPR